MYASSITLMSASTFSSPAVHLTLRCGNLLNMAQHCLAHQPMHAEVEPGGRGLVVGVAVLVLIASMVLPHSGAASGWDVLLRDPDARAEGIGLPSQLFVTFALVAGVLLSAAGVLTRRWAVAWLATAGTGDVLSGIIAAMRARGLSDFEAAAAGVWLHGRSAEIAGANMIADDLVAAIPHALALVE